MKKILLTLGIVAIAATVWYFGREIPVRVRMATVEVGDVKSTVSNTRVGTVEACRRAKMSPSAPGQVSVLRVSEGDWVARGEVLLEIWNGDRKAELRLAEAELIAAHSRAEEVCAIAAGAKREARRLTKLRASELISEELADEAQTFADSRKAACEGARASSRVSAAQISVVREAIERTVLRAPFSGIIAEVDAKLGEYLTPSPPGIATTPAIDLIDPGCVYISAPIDEVDAPQIQVGMPVCITLDAFTQARCAATVRRIAPYVLEREKQARTVEVEVEFARSSQTEGLLPGYSADIEILIEERPDVLRVPTEAIGEGDTVLWLNPQTSRLEERAFDAGLANWEYTEVRSGLTEGDSIALSSGRAEVTTGTLVTPAGVDEARD